MTLTPTLEAAIARVDEIIALAHIPGLSFAIVQNGTTLGTWHRGLRDIARQLPPDDDTRWDIASLSKAFTSALAGILIHEGARNDPSMPPLAWDTPIKNYLPYFRTASDEITEQTTLVDLLSHRWGMGDAYNLWYGSDNAFLIQPGHTTALVRHEEQLYPFRAGWSYNNVGFELVGQVLQRATGKDMGTLLREKIWGPLGMSRTTVRWDDDDDNQVVSYGQLVNKTAIQIPRPFGQDSGMFDAAGAVKSSLGDLLTWYRAVMRATAAQFADGVDETDGSPLKEMRTITSAHAVLPGLAPREQTYALGWARSQLPGQLGRVSMTPTLGTPITAGKGGESRLVLYHHGLMWGTQTAVCLVPESDTAIVVTQNQIPGFDSADFVVQMLLEAVLETPEPNDYVALSREFIARAEAKAKRERSLLEEQRIPGTRPRDLGSYVGRYCGVDGIACMRVTNVGDDGLVFTRESLSSAPERTFRLEHYHHDTFTWVMSVDEQVATVVESSGEPDFWRLEFIADGGGEISRISWLADGDGAIVMDKTGTRRGCYVSALWCMLGMLILLAVLVRGLVKRWARREGEGLLGRKKVRFESVDDVEAKVHTPFLVEKLFLAKL